MTLLIGYQLPATGSIIRTVAAKLQESVSVLDFRADPTGAQDSTSAFQDAVNAAISQNAKLHIPGGTYLVSSVITATGSIWIEGDGKYCTTIMTQQINASIFSFSGYSFKLSDLALKGPSAPTSGALLTCNCAEDDIFNVAFESYFTGINAGSVVGFWSEIDFNEPAVTASIGAIINNYAGGLVVDKAIAFQPAVTPTAGLQINSCGGVLISNCNIIKQGTNLLLSPGNGQSVASVQAVNTYFDSAQNYNIHIAPATGGSVVRTYLTQCEASSSSSHGIFIDGSAGTVDGVCIISAQANLCAGNGINISGANAKNIDIIGGQCAENGGSGVAIGSSANNVTITALRAGAGYGLTGNVDGIYIDGTVSGVKLVGVVAEGNTGTQISDGANSNIIGCVGINNPAYSNFGNGLIIQTGSFVSSATDGAAVAVSFPKPFPNAVVAVIANTNSTSTSNGAAWVDTLSTTGFNGHCAITSVGVNYIAIGY